MISITLATAHGLRSVGSSADPLDGADVTTIAAGGQALWALVRHRHVYRIDRGRAEHVASLDGFVGWCLLEHAGSLFVGTDNAGLFRLRDGALERVAGFDRTEGREDWWQPPGQRPATAWTMASDGDHLFVNVHVGGIARSRDRGESFEPTIDPNDDVHEVSVDPSRQLWAATGQRGLASSSDAGDSWRYFEQGLHAHYLSCVTSSDQGVLVAAASNFGTEDDAVYRFDRAGERFERCFGLPSEFGGTLTARMLVANGKTAAVAGPRGRLFVSKDAGRSWAVAEDGLPNVRAIVIGDSP